ncbi:MAG: gliding motility-associated C-terminal domain-containing protein [Bacteroidetes bacterium]|nr:gliding motility-associated C-terminal domain-containing protein [Bacteroidota bacterium]
MKHPYKPSRRLFLPLFMLMALLFGAAQQAKACHALPILNVVATTSPTGLTLTGDSDPATCGCGPYWMEVEVACSPTSFIGTPPAPNSPLWGTNPWYHSTLNPPSAEACVLEPYFPVFIPYAQLCPGTTYYYRIREFVEASATTGSAWSTAVAFTTPGSPPVTTIQASSAGLYAGCPGDVIQLQANITGGCPGATFQYSWAPVSGIIGSPNQQNPQVVLGATNITYTVTVTGGCVTITSADDTVGLTVGPPPIAGVASSNPNIICAGDTSQILLQGNTSPNLQWYVSTTGLPNTFFTIAGATSPTYNTGPISSTLFYQAIVTGTGWPNGSGCGTSASNIVPVTVSPAPTANAGPDITICPGGTATLNGSGGTSYQWSTSQTTSSISVSPSATTTYTLIAANALGCDDDDQVTVFVAPAQVTASPNVSICSGSQTILIATGQPGMSYSWQPASGILGSTTQANATANPTVTTTYTLVGTNGAGCSDTAFVTVTVTAPPQVSATASASPICAGGTSILTATAQSSTTFTWTPGPFTGATYTVNPIVTTTYVVTANTNGCIDTDTVTVVVDPVQSITAGPDFSICSGTQGTIGVPPQAAGSTYSWTGPGIVGSTTGSSVTVQPTTGPASYSVTVTSANGCISTDVVQVTVFSLPNVTASATDNTVCAGSNTTLTAAGAANFQWIPTVGLGNPNSGQTSANPPNNTSYTVIGTDANGCTDTATVNITILPLPEIYLETTPSNCGDSTGTITQQAVLAGTGPFTFQVNNQTYNSMPITGLTGGTYNVVTTDANGCVNSGPVTINTVNTATVQANASTIFGVAPLTVNFNATSSPGVNNYAWSFGDSLQSTSNQQSPSFTYTSPGVYTVYLSGWNDIQGCEVITAIYITVVEQAQITIPNVFSPNGDGRNDEFQLSVNAVKSIDVIIFNRWGNKVYEGNVSGLPGGQQDVTVWNGLTGAGNMAEDGVYYYTITAVGYDEETYNFASFVHLLKERVN